MSDTATKTVYSEAWQGSQQSPSGTAFAKTDHLTRNFLTRPCARQDLTYYHERRTAVRIVLCQVDALPEAVMVETNFFVRDSLTPL